MHGTVLVTSSGTTNAIGDRYDQERDRSHDKDWDHNHH